MKIRDIVNRDIVNLTNCEHEPIHIPGSIQPHGFLIAFCATSGKITFCSENTASFIAKPYDALLGTDVVSLLGEKKLDSVKQTLSDGASHSRLPIGLIISQNNFSCTVHNRDNTTILECEPVMEIQQELGSIYGQTSRFLSYMEETHTLQQLCQLVANGTRELTGYDRVMIYRFDKEYNGEVFAESCIDTVEPFLGLHYPHTDIPVQARELYMKNLLRLIADINYDAVPIYTIDDGSDKNLDLSLSILRSTSPIHIQYLQNMGVGATLTISLLHQGRLWGLIACHHYSAKVISPEIRLAAQLQGHFITSQIEVRQSNEEFELARKTNMALERLSALDLSQQRSALNDLVSHSDLLAICNANSVAIVFEGQIYKSSTAPSDQLINAIFLNLTQENPFVTDELVQHLPQETDCKMVSGVVLHRFGSESAIIWFRPESLTEIHWGGDPSKAIIKDEKGLSPRNSFALYRETVKCRSRAWHQSELNSAANYAHLLQIHLNLILLREQENRNQELNRELQESNSELENINWISTHDLQEPLRKIQLNASKLLTMSDNLPPAVDLSVRRMESAAKRMQRLLIDIMRYTNLSHTETIFEEVNLNHVITNVLSNLAEQVAESDAHFKIEQLPRINGMPFLLQQLFSNLLLNAIKYSKPDSKPRISIASGEAQELTHGAENALYLPITVSDNGIGFEAEFEESIFKIFTRLTSSSGSQGSGVGLALCKKIMAVHGGHIVAKGKPEKGASFTCFFPVSTSSRPL